MLHLAEMANLEVPKQEIELMANQLQEILDYFNKLGEAETWDTSVGYGISEVTNRFREDVAKPFLADDILNSVPQRKGRYVRAPRAI